MIWYVPKQHGHSIFLGLKSLMVKIEFQLQKVNDFNDGKWQTKLVKVVIVKITKAERNMYAVKFEYSQIVL